MSVPRKPSTSDEPNVGSSNLPAGEIILAQAYISRRQLPANFNEDDRKLFEHELEKQIPETRLLELHDVRAGSDGVLFKGGKILPESFAFPFLFDDWTRGARMKFLARNYLLKKQRRVDRDALWLVDNWSYGYFHWLTDVLSRLFLIRDHLEGLTLVLPHRYRQLELVAASLKAFAVPQIEYIDQGESVLFDKLIMPTHAAPSGHYREDVIQSVSKRLVDFYGASSEAGAERLYISRGKAPKRRISNEDDVQSVLREFGFRVIYAEDHSFREQVAMASHAHYLISNHGAGLTNMLFMRPGNKVLELRHAGDCVNNCYFVLASALNLKYFYQTCIPGDASEDPHSADLIVDLTVLRESIKQMLGA